MNAVVFINGPLGIRVLDYISNLKEHHLSAVFLNSDSKRASNYINEVSKLLDEKNITPPVVPWVDNSFQINATDINFSLPTFGVSALFGHVLPSQLVNSFSGGILNLHPSLLPNGRGADPIPWSIIKKQRQGISLHLIDEGLDTGRLVFQKEIITTIDMNAGAIYDQALIELFTEFTNHFPSWVKGEIATFPQGTSDISSNKSNALEKMRVIEENEIGTFGDFIRRFQATTFSNGKKPIFKDDVGKLWEIDFRISKQESNEQ